MSKKIRAAVIGANGYAGAEIVRLLSAHPFADPKVVTSRAHSGKPVSDVIFGMHDSMTFADANSPEIRKCDVVFVALPQTAGAEIVGELIDSGIRVIDMSADYRFDDVSLYEHTYGVKHPRPDLCRSAVYGLCEHNREKIKTAKLVANPGCYVTSALIPLIPLVSKGIVSDIIIDAKSGTSGAGRKSDEAFSFCTVDESFKAYGVFTHRHAPEISEKLGVNIIFTPHLLPIKRGILSTIYFKVNDVAAANAALHTAYSDEKFVTYSDALPQISQVAHTNNCVFSARFDGDNGIIVSVIDNLLKGAAGQAVQNMNIMFGFDETAGLPRVAPV